MLKTNSVMGAWPVGALGATKRAPEKSFKWRENLRVGTRWTLSIQCTLAKVKPPTRKLTMWIQATNGSFLSFTVPPIENFLWNCEGFNDFQKTKDLKFVKDNDFLKLVRWFIERITWPAAVEQCGGIQLHLYKMCVCVLVWPFESRSVCSRPVGDHY